MRIAILGAGAIGCLFGLRLEESGQKVLLIHHRKRVVNAVRIRGVTVRELSRRVFRHRIDIKSSLPKNYDPDLVLLTVKSYDTETATRSIEKSIFSCTTVLSLQNGLGNGDILRQHLDPGQILEGTTTEAAVAMGPGKIDHTGIGSTWIGEPNGRITERAVMIRGILQKAGFQTYVSADIEGILWSKAIVNSAINPITSLERVPNGEISNIRELKDVAVQVIREGAAVAAAKGVVLRPFPTTLLTTVISSTSRNKSSMLQDLENGRRTEIRQLNGQISAIGRKLGIPTPRNDLLLRLVVGIEVSRRNQQTTARITNRHLDH